MEKQKLIYVESKALFSPSSVSNKAIVFIKDTKEIWTHGTYFICSNIWATPITLTLSGDSTGSVSIDGSGNVTLLVKNKYLDGTDGITDANNAVLSTNTKIQYYTRIISSASNLFPASNNANAILTLNTHDYTYNHQLGFSSNKGIYHRTRNAGTWETSWREILTSTNYTNYLNNTYLQLTGGTLTDTLILKAGAFTASNSNSYSGGRYQAVSKPNMRLIGDSTYGLSTIEFTSQKGDTSINKPSDSGFIQFLPYGVSALSSVGSHPTLKTSGETNALVLGVTNDSDDIIVLQSPNVSGLRHACGATEYYLPHITTSTTSINRPLLSTTTAHVYLLGPSALGDAAYLPLSKFVYATSDTYYSYGTTEASGKSSTLTRTQFWRDNDRAMIGVYVQHSINADYGFELASSYGADSLEYRRKWNGTWETALKILTNTNYSTYLNNTYLPLSGGTMTGVITLTSGADAANYKTALSFIKSSDKSEQARIGTDTSNGLGLYAKGTIYIRPNVTLGSNSTNGLVISNSSFTYNGNAVLTSSNYTNYTIGYANELRNYKGYAGVISDGKLYYNNVLEFAVFAPDDNLGATSYELIAELTNYDTGTNTSYIVYGISGFMWSYRAYGAQNSSSYSITAIVSIGKDTYSRLRVPVTTNVLVPFVVKYNNKYYLALRKLSSETNFYFMGYKKNLLTTTIKVNDTSLIEEIKGPETETSTASKFYNNGNPQTYLHTGNYNYYALPLAGGTLTGKLDVGGDIYSSGYVRAKSGFIKTDSSDSYVLLGGGGHKLLSDFVLTSSLNNYVTLSTDLTVSGKKLFNNQLIIRKDVGDTDSKVIDIQHDLQLQVRRDSNTHSVAIGVMPTGAGVIWAKANGIGYNTLYLNPYNNGVAIGCGGNGALPNLNDGYYFHIFGTTLSNNSITATKFIKSGGTSSQFLKADGSLDSTAYLPLSGGTMTGALNFKNNTWNKVGDDAYMGDCDVAGMIGIKGANAATTGFAMYNNSGNLLGKLYASGTSLYWSNAKILTASGTSKLFVMGDGSLYSDTVSYTTWDKTTTSGIAWFPIADITDDKLGTALFMVKAYAHSSIIFTVVKGLPYGNINVLAGGGNFNNSYAYIKGVRLVGTVVEIGLNAAATYVSVAIRVLLPTFIYSLYSSLVESTSTTTPSVQYELNTNGGNHNFGIVSSKFTGNLIGNADTASKWVTARTITLTGDVTGSVTLDGSSNVTLATTTSGTGTTSFLKCIDKRNNYPALIVTAGGNIGAAFIHKSMLGGAEGTWYDAIVLRGYVDDSAGNENALLFSKNSSSVYHSLYAFGSTTTWGTLYKFLDSGNYKNYAPSLSGEGATGTWGISISGTASKVANALTLLLNGGTTAGTNKFVYDGSSAYTVNITPAAIGASATTHNHDGSYLKLIGGTLGSSSASVTELRTQSSTAALRIMSYSDSTNYILSGNSTFDGNATLKITGYSNVTGTNLYFKFSNIYCRENDYINIDSGNYGSYALPLSGGTMTGTINCKAIVPITDNGYSIGTSSKTLYEIHANFFKRRGSSNDYVLLGGGEHKLISDFVLNYTAVVPGGSVGNNDSWTLILNNNYSTGWYNPCTMFYIRSHNFGCGILCFYHYWNTELTSGYYDNSVWFFGAEHSAYSGTMGGTGRDINNFLKVYIDKDNDNLKIYYNRYNNLGILILELLFSLYLAGTLYPKGLIRASHFITNGAVTDLPITSSTFVNIPILTVKNHTEDIKTTRSVYASAFYENSDIRLKENVHSIDLIDLLKNVDLVLFNFKNDLNKKYGVIAQQLEQVGLNNLVYEHNGNKAVDYISLLVLETLRLRNEIKELKEKLDKKELSS